jgi:hypothetical protein
VQLSGRKFACELAAIGCELPDGDAWAAIEVVNGTPEPDGTRKRYFPQVPPNMLTARSAIAWTCGFTARQYRGLLMRT